jgi:hypothetical protein
MTLRFAAAVLLLLAAFTILLHAAQTQRDWDRALTSRLDPLPVPPHDASSLHNPRG